jgi:hypothetical protein
VAAFGGVDEMSRDFMVTYRGRLWASTIGQLLPVVAAPGDAPGVVVWLARFDRLIAIFSLVAAAALAVTAPPLTAVLGGLWGAFAAGVIWLAALAIGRGQVWAVVLSGFVCFVNALIFVASLGQPPGGWTISLNGLAGLLLLLRLLANLDEVSRWTQGSQPISNRLGWPIGIPLVGWALIAGFAGHVPDPTQIGPSDVHATALVTCAVPAGATEQGEPLVPTATIDLRVTYDRVDAWPRGLLRDAGSWGDVIEVDVGPLGGWASDIRATGTGPDGHEVAVDISVWAEVPASLGAQGDEDHIVGEILGADQRPGRTIRVVIPTMTTVGDARSPDEVGAPLEGMVATIRVHHLDRFTLRGSGACGEDVPLEPRH